MALANGGNESELKARLSTRMAFGTAGKYAPCMKTVLHVTTGLVVVV